jgi:hypothetical protein
LFSSTITMAALFRYCRSLLDCGGISCPQPVWFYSSISVGGGIVCCQDSRDVLIPVVYLVRKLEGECSELLLDCAHRPFRHAVCLRPVWCHMPKMNSMFATEAGQLTGPKSASIVRDKLRRISGAVEMIKKGSL